MAAQGSQLGHLRFLRRLEDYLRHERGRSVVDQLARHSIRRRTDPWYGPKGIRFHERSDVAIEAQHRLRRSLVAPRPLAVARKKGEVEQQSSQAQVDVRRYHC